MITASYIVNLIDANERAARGAAIFKKANLSKILEDIQKTGRQRPAQTFGERMNAEKKSEVSKLTKGWYFDNLDYFLKAVNYIRKAEVHEGRLEDISNRMVYNYLTEEKITVKEFVACLEKASTVKIGKDVSYISFFATTDRRILDFFHDLTEYFYQSIGQAILDNRKILSKKELATFWQYLNIRNEYIHTGRQLCERKKAFLERFTSIFIEVVEKLRTSKKRAKGREYLIEIIKRNRIHEDHWILAKYAKEKKLLGIVPNVAKYQDFLSKIRLERTLDIMKIELLNA